MSTENPKPTGEGWVAPTPEEQEANLDRTSDGPGGSISPESVGNSNSEELSQYMSRIEAAMPTNFYKRLVPRAVNDSLIECGLTVNDLDDTTVNEIMAAQNLFFQNGFNEVNRPGIISAIRKLSARLEALGITPTEDPEKANESSYIAGITKDELNRYRDLEIARQTDMSTLSAEATGDYDPNTGKIEVVMTDGFGEERRALINVGTEGLSIIPKAGDKLKIFDFGIQYGESAGTWSEENFNRAHRGLAVNDEVSYFKGIAEDDVAEAERLRAAGDTDGADSLLKEATWSIQEALKPADNISE